MARGGRGSGGGEFLLFAGALAFWFFMRSRSTSNTGGQQQILYWIRRDGSNEVVHAPGILPPDGLPQNQSAWRPASQYEIDTYYLPGSTL
jgi:hypothetical protein